MSHPLKALRRILADKEGLTAGVVLSVDYTVASISTNKGIVRSTIISGIQKGSRVYLNAQNVIVGRAPSADEIVAYVV